MRRMALVSSTGVLALLDEPQTALQVQALRSLNQIVDVFWAEIASSIAKLWDVYAIRTWNSTDNIILQGIALREYCVPRKGACSCCNLESVLPSRGIR